MKAGTYGIGGTYCGTQLDRAAAIAFAIQACDEFDVLMLDAARAGLQRFFIAYADGPVFTAWCELNSLLVQLIVLGKGPNGVHVDGSVDELLDAAVDAAVALSALHGEGLSPTFDWNADGRWVASASNETTVTYELAA